MEQVDTKKFDTCRFRSGDKEEYGKKWCCGENLRRGYVCFELNLRDLEPVVCQHCKHYQAKLNG